MVLHILNMFKVGAQVRISMAAVGKVRLYSGLLRGGVSSCTSCCEGTRAGAAAPWRAVAAATTASCLLQAPAVSVRHPAPTHTSVTQ